MTLLRTDIVGSTERAASLGDLEWHRLLERHDRILMNHRSEFGGIDLGSAGDGFLIAFTRPISAVACAAAIRSSVSKIGLKIRCGLHTGECERQGDRFAGIALHIATRVEGLASPGQIVATGATREALVGSEIRFTDMGTHELKGLDDRWHVLSIDAVPSKTLFDARRREWRSRERSTSYKRLARSFGVIAVSLTALLLAQQVGPWPSKSTIEVATLESGTGVLAFAVREGSRYRLQLQAASPVDEPSTIGSFDHLRSLAWSPDGCHLTFVTGPTASLGHVFVADTEGHTRRLTRSPDDFRVIDWSANSRQLLVSRGSVETDTDFLTLDVQTGQVSAMSPRKLNDFSAAHPVDPISGARCLPQ